MVGGPFSIEEIQASPSVELWRFMIDQQHQGKGIGKAALDIVVEYVKELAIKCYTRPTFQPRAALGSFAETTALNQQVKGMMTK